VSFSSDGRILASGSYDKTIKLRDVKSGKLLVTLYSFPDASLALTPEGYFSGTGNYKDYVHFVDFSTFKVYDFDQFAERFYRPELVTLALAGGKLPKTESISSIVARKPAPEVRILSPEDGFKTSSDTLNLKVRLINQGGGIGDIVVKINGIAVAGSSTRSIKARRDKLTLSFTLKLKEGENKVEVIAYNKDRSMYNHEKLRVFSDYKLSAPDLYALVVGIDKFRNEELNLKYAVKDATLFANTLRDVASPLFRKVKVVLLTKPEETTKEAIEKAFERIGKEVKANDYFIFYAATHGDVSSFDDGREIFFLITSNVLFYDPQNLEKSAISHPELVNLIAKIPAQNKVIVLDACHSGEAGRKIMLALAETQKLTFIRGMDTKTAIEILRKAAGGSVFTASQSVENALEGFKGHGLFTYTLVEGLKGKADANGDGFVKLDELKSYVEEKVFERSKEIFRKQQVPYISIGSFDFPVSKVK